MRRKDLRAFQILEEFEHNQVASQRQLARKLNVSLGLMNAALKDMEEQGLFTVDHLNGNRNRYILTSEGIAEKMRLSREYVKHSLYYYRAVRKRIIKFLTALENDGMSTIAFCGIGLLTEISYLCLKQTNLVLTAVIEDNSLCDLYFGTPIITMEESRNHLFDCVLITVTEAVAASTDRLHSNGIARKKIKLLWN